MTSTAAHNAGEPDRLHVFFSILASPVAGDIRGHGPSHRGRDPLPLPIDSLPRSIGSSSPVTIVKMENRAKFRILHRSGILGIKLIYRLGGGVAPGRAKA